MSLAAAASLHPLHRAWRLLPARSRRQVLARASALLAPRPDPVAPPARHGLAIAGELGRPSGLGEAARLMLAGLRALNVASWEIEAGLPVPGEDRAAGETQAPPPGAPLVLHVNPPVLPAVLLSLPRGLLRGRRVIGYWTWELPVAPKAWQEGAPFVHEVWTVSRFAADALEPLLPGRVRVVPSPLAVRPPEPSALGRGDFGLPETALVTLASFNLASSFVRKNPLGAIAAHRAAFGARADRVLLIKLINPHHFAADFEHIRAVAAELPNVRLETRTMPAADAHALTACCDIVLSLHRSEGYGLIPAEAMLLGRPVVATGWSGNMDYMDDECACLVPFRLVAARDPRGIYEVPGAVWAEPDIGAAAEHLRRLADDAALRAALGVRGRMAAQARLGPELLAEACQAMGLSVG